MPHKERLHPINPPLITGRRNEAAYLFKTTAYRKYLLLILENNNTELRQEVSFWDKLENIADGSKTNMANNEVQRFSILTDISLLALLLLLFFIFFLEGGGGGM